MAINRDIKVGLALVVLLSVLVGVFYYIFSDKNKYQWNENYLYDNDQPYGADILYNLLDEYNGNETIELIDKETITKFFNDRKLLGENSEQTKKATYIIIGYDLDFAARDYESLLAFMKKGNTVMLISNVTSTHLFQKLNYECAYSSYGSNYLNATNLFSVKSNFENENLKNRKGYNFFYEYLSKRYEKDYYYFGSSFCRALNYETLGTIRPNKTNYIRIPHGKGQLLLHSNPIFFSNRHLIRKQGAEYAGKVFSYIPDGEIYWDKHNKPVKIKKPAMEGNEDDTPFSYILKQRSFKWALYLIYFAVILFLIFNLFRKQKEIPVKFQNKNTSLEFIKNVGTLYFENKDNKKLAYKIMQHFMNEIRLKYFIKDKESEIIIEKLASKTKVDSKMIAGIFNAYSYLEKQEELSDNGLIKFYLKIEKFHNAVKK